MKFSLRSQVYPVFAVNVLMLLTVAVPAAFGGELGLKERFDQGLVQEEVHHDLSKAIEHYEAVVASYDERRELISMSLYRLAECLRKMGRMDEAAPIYARIVAEFSDQRELVKLSQRYVPISVVGSSIPGSKAPSASEDSFINRPDGLRLLIDQLRDGSVESSLYSLAQLAGDLKASQLLNTFLDTQSGLETLKRRYSDKHPRVRQQEAELESDWGQMQTHALWAAKFLETRLKMIEKVSVMNVDKDTLNRLRIVDDPVTLRAFIHELEKASDEIAVQMVIAETDQEGLSDLLKSKESLQIELAGKRNLYGSDHSEIVSIQARIDATNEQISNHVLRVIKQLRIKLKILEQAANSSVSTEFVIP